MLGPIKTLSLFCYTQALVDFARQPADPGNIRFRAVSILATSPDEAYLKGQRYFELFPIKEPGEIINDFAHPINSQFLVHAEVE